MIGTIRTRRKVPGRLTCYNAILWAASGGRVCMSCSWVLAYCGIEKHCVQGRTLEGLKLNLPEGPGI